MTTQYSSMHQSPVRLCYRQVIPGIESIEFNLCSQISISTEFRSNSLTVSKGVPMF